MHGLLILMLIFSFFRTQVHPIVPCSKSYDQRHTFNSHSLPLPYTLHILGCPWVLVHRMLDILHFASRLFPRRFVPFRPVNVTLRELHLS
jgi:hypothetical protein